MKSLKMFGIAILTVAAMSSSMMAKADNVEYVDLTFQSGATFTGTVDFSSDYSQLTGVSGTLAGYQSGDFGYVGSGNDAISWIWIPGDNFASDSDDFGNFLMDGTSSTGYNNFIAFTYNYSSAPTLTLAPGDSYGVEVDYDDPMVSGSISAIAPTPEPDTMLLLGSGLVGLAGMVRRKMAGHA